MFQQSINRSQMSVRVILNFASELKLYRKQFNLLIPNGSRYNPYSFLQESLQLTNFILTTFETMKIILAILFMTASNLTIAQKNIYSFSFKDIDGNSVSFEKFKGKKILIVNTASECGFTPQYK